VRRLIRIIVTCFAPALIVNGAAANEPQSREIGLSWPPIARYSNMDCGALEVERAALIRDLRDLQLPENLDNQRWTEAKNRFHFLNRLYGDQCGTLSMKEQELPLPPALPLAPEAHLNALAQRAMRSGRNEMAEAIWLQGAMADYPESQYNLGMYYTLFGRSEEGTLWLRSAAARGSNSAREMLRSRGEPAGTGDPR